MNKRIFIALAGVVALTAPALAKDKKSAAPAPEASGPTSEQSRVGKHHMVALEILGVQLPVGIGSALRYGFYLNSNTMIGVQYASAEKKFDSDEDGFSDDDSDYDFDLYDAQRTGKASLFEIQFKKFVTNSFYWSAGIGDRQKDTKLEAWKDSFLSDDEERTTIAATKTHDAGVSGAIGNQWQWENFTMGCDWVGLYLPLAHISQKKTDGSTPADGSGADSKRKKFYEDEKDMHAMGVRFYLGASF